MKTKTVCEDTQNHSKGWGYEYWMHNDGGYCFKKLVFTHRSKTSLHFHRTKRETFYVDYGQFRLVTINVINGKRLTQLLRPGDYQNIPECLPHQLVCLSRSGMILESSTQHFEDDSYRIEPGDSQTKHAQKTQSPVRKAYCRHPKACARKH